MDRICSRRRGLWMTLVFSCGMILTARSLGQEGSQRPATAAKTGRNPARSIEEAPKSVTRGQGSAGPGGAVLAGSAIREPSQGRPIFITPGDTFYFVMELPSGVEGDVTFIMRHALEPSVSHALRATTPPSYTDAYCSLVLASPDRIQSGLYDLEVTSQATTFRSKRCVKVVDSFKSAFRFVHLSNMNVGDLTAPMFDDLLPREINFLAPEFIVATGDYTEWARARDDEKSWLKILKYFEQFNAPVFMLCGGHDHQDSFSQYVASKPIGTIDYGPYHGLLLLDHPGNPIDQDLAQLQWIETDLKRNKNKKMNFIACNSDELALLDIWRESGNLDDFLREHKIKLFLTGGSTDWDFKEFADRLKGLDDLQFVRTHQASTSMRDRATGCSHYRVIDIDGDKIAYTYPDDDGGEKLQNSIPSGRMRAFYDAPNNGTASRITLTLQNALNQGFENVHAWLRIAKKGDAKPHIAPGRLVQMIDTGKYWACDVVLNVPDKGAVRLMAAIDPAQIPAAIPVEVGLDGPREWAFEQKNTEFGLSYFESDSKVTLNLTNKSTAPLSCWPVVRVNGGELHPDRQACPRLPVRLEPGKALSIPLVLQLRRVSPGPHVMQVHFLEDPLSRLSTFGVTLAHKQSTEPTAQATGPAGQ